VAAGDFKIIPINKNYLSQFATVALDSIVYRFKFEYNSRAECWMVSLLTSDSVAIFTGRKLLAGRNPFLGYVSSLSPKGKFIVMDDGVTLIYEETV
jgi:hypothetical protein